MKIAVLTLSLHANYGGTLQAYALLTALKDLGHEAWFLNRERYKVAWWKSPFILGWRAVKKYVFRREVKIGTGILDRQKRFVISTNFRQFNQQYIQPQTQEFLTSRELSNLFSSLGFDAVIVGSDQVWRQRFARKNLSDYYLGFIPEDDLTTKRISYAASFGTSDWEYSKEEESSCKELIRRFNAVSVRESNGVDLCKIHFGVNAEHVIDPTLMLLPERYVQLIPEPQKAFSGILIYVLDESSEKQQLINKIAKALKLPVFRVNGVADKKITPLRDQVAPPVEDWLRGFRDASFVITDSFHGTVFSILFNKPFVAYGNKSRGLARFSSLLEMFGLQNRLVTGPEGFSDDLLNQPDWKSINFKLDAKRAEARAFIQKALAP